MDEPITVHTKITFQTGEVIIEAGDDSSQLFLLEEGEIEVVKNDRVLAIIKDKRTFFGEMSFLSKSKRTATLRAKTKVVAYRIDQSADETFEARLATASITLMKVMATRLDISNREAKRLEPYQEFYGAMKELCAKNKETQDLFDLVEKEVDFRQKSEHDDLLSRYLKTPWIWTRLETAIFDILQCYLKEELKITSVEAWQSVELLGHASGIEFTGDRDGILILDLDKSIATKIQHQMGLEDGQYQQETTEELNNLVLGQLKRVVKDHSIQLKTPEPIQNQTMLAHLLRGEPALKIEVASQYGKMRLIYQLEN